MSHSRRASKMQTQTSPHTSVIQAESTSLKSPYIHVCLLSRGGTHRSTGARAYSPLVQKWAGAYREDEKNEYTTRMQVNYVYFS